MDLSKYAALFLAESREHLSSCNQLAARVGARARRAREPVGGLFRVDPHDQGHGRHHGLHRRGRAGPPAGEPARRAAPRPGDAGRRRRSSCCSARSMRWARRSRRGRRRARAVADAALVRGAGPSGEPGSVERRRRPAAPRRRPAAPPRRRADATRRAAARSRSSIRADAVMRGARAVAGGAAGRGAGSGDRACGRRWSQLEREEFDGRLALPDRVAAPTDDELGRRDPDAPARSTRCGSRSRCRSTPPAAGARSRQIRVDLARLDRADEAGGRAGGRARTGWASWPPAVRRSGAGRAERSDLAAGLGDAGRGDRRRG